MYIVDQKAVDALASFCQEIPTKHGAPVINWLNTSLKKVEAQKTEEQKVVDEEKKPEESGPKLVEESIEENK